MKPSSRRRIEREVREIMRIDGDRCSLCGRVFPHNSRTFGGITPVGRAALVGGCCEMKLGHTILSGLYVNQDFADLPTTGRSGTESISAVQVEHALNAMQAVFDDRGALRTRVASRAGLEPARTKISFAETTWKSDDAAWFNRHPTRSHRLRPLIGDEAASFGSIAEQPIPPRHELQVIVRQIEPGQRVRSPFGRSLDMPIPDVEEVLHALFDIVSNGGGGPAISVRDVLQAVAAYGRAAKGKPN